ncbi:MAG: hypothetical protein K0R58_3101 [Ramlibacter sp.]|nr:hypothetical protein [Ramlibacter sp.]
MAAGVADALRADCRLASACAQAGDLSGSPACAAAAEAKRASRQASRKAQADFTERLAGLSDTCGPGVWLSFLA